MGEPNKFVIAFAAAAVFGISVLAGSLIAGATNDSTAVAVGAPPSTSATNTSSTTSTTTTTITPVAAEPIQQTSTTTSPPLQQFPDLFEKVRGAVANVDVVRCGAGSQGSAFLVNAETAYTAWHVVEDAVQVALNFGEERVEASVIGRDIARDVAVLRLARPIEGAATIPVASTEPRVGEEVAAIGHPQGLPLAMTVGRVTSMNGDFDFSGTGDAIVENLIQTDSVVAPGSSGGPLLNQRGEAIGVVILRDVAAQGLMYAANVDGVRSQLVNWTLNPEPVRPAFCVGAVNLDDIDQVAPELIASEVETPDVLGLQRTFAVFTQTINSGRPDEAFAVLGPGITNGTDRDVWVQSQSTSNLWDWRIRQISASDAGLSVRSTFRSTQEAEFGFDGQSTCTRWDLTHDMVRGEFQGREFWLINNSRRTDGVDPVDCEDWEPTVIQRQRLIINQNEQTVTAQDLLSAGTIDDWPFMINHGGGANATSYEIKVESLDGSLVPRLRVVTTVEEIPGQVEQGAENPTSSVRLEIDSTSRGSIQISELSENASGRYRVTITNLTNESNAEDTEVEGEDEGTGNNSDPDQSPDNDTT